MSNTIAAIRNVFSITPVALALIASACGQGDDASPASPHKVRPEHTVYYDGIGTDLDVYGHHLAIAAKQGGVTLFETTSPTRPVRIAYVASALAYQVLLQDKALFVFDEQQGLGSITLRNLDALQLTPALSTVELYGFIHDAIWANNSLIFASDATGLSSYRIERNFQLRGDQNTFPASPTQGLTSIDLSGNRLVAGSYPGGLSIYSWQQKTPPALTGWAITKHPVADLDCSTNHCYVAGLGDGLFVYRMPKDGSPDLLQAVSLGKAIDQIYVDEELVFAAALGTGDDFAFYVFTRDDNGIASLRTTVKTQSPIRDFARVDQFVYVLLEDGRMQIYARESLL